MFIARDTDLTVGVQTTARAPFVSLFSGVSIGGRERWSEGFLEAKLTETHKDVRSTVGLELKHLSQPQESSEFHQEVQDSPKKAKIFQESSKTR